MARAKVSVKDDQNFRNRCEREIRAFDEWPIKWGWTLDEYKKRNKKLDILKKKEIIREDNFDHNKIDHRSVLPFPTTTSREIGWLSTKEEFQLEIYGPYILHVPNEIKPKYMCKN